MSDIDKTEPELLALYYAIDDIGLSCSKETRLPSTLGTRDPAYALRILALIRAYGQQRHAEGFDIARRSYEAFPPPR